MYTRWPGRTPARRRAASRSHCPWASGWGTKPASLGLLAQFDGYPDPTGSKAGAHVVGIKPALEHANLTLKPHATVERLETGAGGRRVSGVILRQPDGSRVIYRAEIVVMTAGAVNPTLTIVAQTLRVAGQIRERLGAMPGAAPMDKPEMLAVP